jgi:hypothetical protein
MEKELESRIEICHNKVIANIKLMRKKPLTRTDYECINCKSNDNCKSYKLYENQNRLSVKEGVIAYFIK